jgi:hypothetical protein
MLYFNDTVEKIKGVGKIAKQRLSKNGIMTVGDLHGLHSDQRLIVEIARRMKGLPVAFIMQFLKNIKDLSHEDALPIVYCNEENPYTAKFGSEKNEWDEPAWIHEKKKLQTFAKTMCIIDLVKHMVIEAKNAMQIHNTKTLTQFTMMLLPESRTSPALNG